MGGDVYYNTLTNQGTIGGSQFTPLALPVFATLPPVLVRQAGTTNVTVANAGSTTLAEGSYGDLVVGNAGTVHLTGGGYAFKSITIRNSAAIRFAGPTDIVVSGRIDFGNSSLVQAENGSGLTPAAIRIQVDGINGSSGALTATPPAAHVANAGKVFANLYVTAGSLNLDNAFEGNGAFIARDIHAAQGTKFTINSAFNLAPIADPQSVTTSGTSPLPITLTGSDPEGGSLLFTIVSAPGAGTLSTPVQASPSSANVTYTPSSANVADAFTFRVRDAGGATGDAVVTINAQKVDPPPPDPTTVVATDSSVQTTKDVPATLVLGGTAPAGVALTFSIVSSTGPFHGTLGAVTQGSEVPERSATVVYTPDAGYAGPDSFQFRACGVIGSTNVCDDASFSITVLAGLVEPPPSIAHDVSASTNADTSIDISLGETSIQGFRRLLPVPRAATLDAVEIAGNVADSDANGLGDNANALPGLTPIFMSAGVNQAGTAGSSGTVRMQFEWDMSSIVGTVDALQSAAVILPTHRGTVDSLDTTFYWVATGGDGLLTNSDFESPAEPISDAVM
ncbi:MAG: Ig-like domain-containing protein, partial [Vicinamibacterales bacterium]